MMESTFQSFAEMPALYIHPHRCSEWLPHIPSGIATPLLGNRRLTRRLSALITAHYGLSQATATNRDDMAIALLGVEALSRLIHLSGAIFYGQYLRTEISGTAIAGLLSGLDPLAYEAAVKQAGLGPEQEVHGETGPPALLTREIMLRDGHRCFCSWVKTLPPPIAKRIWLKFPDDPVEDDPPPVFHTRGPKIVRTAAEHIFQHASQ
jgi:hypothetical protein